MQGFIETVERVNNQVNSFAWGPVMLTLLVGTGIYLTVRLGFLQCRHFGYILKNTIGTLFSGKKSGENGNNLSPFQAVTTALAGTVGTGNIAGVTGAIITGGPGAVFWMWFSAFFGMVTKYAEIALAVRYRIVDEDGVHHGGPMYYIEKGLGKGWKWLSVIFAVLGGLASFGIGNMSQGNEIAGSMKDLFGVSPIVTGILLAAVVAVVILGGVKRIGTVTSYLVPFMSVFYIAAGIVIILMKLPAIPGVLADICKSAFTFRAAAGGAAGYAVMTAMRMGVARGVFSNEAGLGSAPIAHAASSTEEPCEQAMWGVFEVFVDTIVICTITALAILLSGVFDRTVGVDSRMIFGDVAAGALFTSKGSAAAAAFNTILPGEIGGTIIQISLLCFALSTIISWSYYGLTCWEYVTGGSKTVSLVYRIVFSLVCIVGAIGSGQLMWDISDTLNGLMAIPNLIALLLLSGTVISLTKKYFSEAGK